MENARYPELAKLSINSLIDLWAIDESFEYKTYSSWHDDDCPPGALKSVFHYEGGQIQDFTLKEQLSSGGISNRPLIDTLLFYIA